MSTSLSRRCWTCSSHHRQDPQSQLLAYAGAAPTPRQPAISLVNDLGDHGPVALALDDVHEVTDAATWDVLDGLLEHLPPDVRVVLGRRRPARGGYQSHV